MTNSVRLMVLTAAVFPSEAEARSKMWIFLKSAEKAGVPKEDLHLYGVGRGFGGYRHMKLECQLDYLKEHRHEGYTHVLYHDGWDGMFTGHLAEVLAKYQGMGNPPMLSSASTGLGNVPAPGADYPNCFDETILYRYPCVGGYISEYGHIIDMFERMLQLPRQTGDDCFNWYDAWQEGWFRPQLDSACRIFQVTADNTEVQGCPGRLANTVTGQQPCLFHLSGGYTDQVTGKDHVMVPWAKRLGVIE